MVWHQRADVQVSHETVEDVVLDVNFGKHLQTTLTVLEPPWIMLRSCDTDGFKYTPYIYNNMVNDKAHINDLRNLTNSPNQADWQHL